MDLSTRVVTGVSSELHEIETEWRALLLERPCTPFQSFDWARAWLKCVAPRAELCIVMVGDPVEALLPLVLDRPFGVRRLRILGHGLSDYLGAIPTSPARGVFTAIGECIAAQSACYDLVDMQGLHCSVEDSRCLASALPKSAIQRVYEHCPVIDTNRDWDAFLASRTRKFRANLKRTIRRTESLGAADVEIEAATSELFQEMIDVERDSWKWEGGYAYLRDEVSRAFLNTVLLQTDVDSEVWTCRIDGLLVSFAVVFREPHVRYYYLPSFRSGFPDTGTFLLARLVRDSCEQGIREIDLLQGDERYKSIWASSSRDVHQIVSPGRGPRGAAALAGYRLRW